MQRAPRPEGLDFPSPFGQLPRNRSVSADRTPLVSGSSLPSPPSVNPDPAYIAAAAASQIVRSLRADPGQELYNGEHDGSGRNTALVSSESLILVNGFLDQLLFSFLASARSTSIASLKPAILDVLRPKLGKEAIDGADDELRGYLSGGDIEELMVFHSELEFKGEHNLGLVWRRTRLRCMVYTRLGDMEEEDEEMYLKNEPVTDANDERPRLSRDLGWVSPAAAIFLTSVLEFLGEQVLLVAGEAAHNRMQSKQSLAQGPLTVVVETGDMERLAFNTTMGRLWRSWRKRTRSSSFLSMKPVSREMQRQKSGSLSASDSAGLGTSISEENESGYFGSARGPWVPQTQHENDEQPQLDGEDTHKMPREPDFSDFSAHESPSETRKSSWHRPRSMVEYENAIKQTPTGAQNGEDPPSASGLINHQARPSQQRQRSSSMPSKRTPYISPINFTFATPSDGPDPFIRDVDRSTDGAKTVPALAQRKPAVSTMYDGVIGQGTTPMLDTMAERNNRGISTYTEASNHTDEYDHEMAPEALNLNKPAVYYVAERQESPVSPLSSNDTFDLGDVVSVGHSGPSIEGSPEREQTYEYGISQIRSEVDGQTTGVDSDSHQAGNFAKLAALQGHQLRTYDESGKAVKRDIPVIYDAPSEANATHHHEPASAGIHDEGDVIEPSSVERPNGHSTSGVPPLTPLRELMDAAHDTSDESSIAPSNNATPRPDEFVPTHRYHGSDGAKNASLSSSLTHGQLSTTARELLDQRSQPLAVNTGTERAAVQRVSPSPVTPLSATGRVSISSNRPMTANSTHSQMSSKIKGIIGMDSGDHNRQPMPKRTSSDESGSLIRTPTKEQDFEQLIHSEETVKYTLTPQNMRSMEATDSPRLQGHARSGTADLADFLRDSAPPVAELERPSTSRSSTKFKGLGLRSNPVNSTSPTTMTHGSKPFADTVKSQSKPIPKSPNPRVPGVLPRDPSTNSDSVRDFADFIRSTGPDSPAKALPKPVLSSTKSSRPSSSSSPAIGTGTSQTVPKKITKQNSVHMPQKKPDAQLSKGTVPKLQARDAAVVKDNTTADLADFFRSGPVGAQVDGPSAFQRPSVVSQRTVSTNGSANGRIREAFNSGSSGGTTHDSVTASQVTQSSTNSRTGLLDSSNRAPPVNAPSKYRNNIKQPARNDDPPPPARTQRRVRDPYAIDSDDENEGSNGTPQATQPHEEESLSDFLRDYTPSPPSTANRHTPPALHGVPKTTKQSPPSMRERITRNMSSDHRSPPPKSTHNSSISTSPPQSANGRKSVQRTESATSFRPPSQNNIIRGRSTEHAPQLPPLSPRVTSPPLISHLDTNPYHPSQQQSTSTRQPDRSAPRRQLQAREEHGVMGGKPPRGGMGDLAEFLRDTEPPAPSGPVARPNVARVAVKEKEESAFGRIFGRKKKT